MTPRNGTHHEQWTDWALITGAGHWNGAALSRALSASGVGAVLVGPRQASITAARKGLGCRVPTLIVPADIASIVARVRFVAAAKERLPFKGSRLRHLVEDARIGLGGYRKSKRETPGGVTLTVSLAVNARTTF